MARIYAWEAKYGKTHDDAQAVGEAVESLADERGAIEPERLAEAGRTRGNPLYPHFTHDRERAARSWNLAESRVLLDRLRLDNGKCGPRAYVVTRAEVGGDRSVYVPYRVRAKAARDAAVKEHTKRDEAAVGEAWGRSEVPADAAHLLVAYRSAYVLLARWVDARYGSAGIPALPDSILADLRSHAIRLPTLLRRGAA